MAKKKVEDIDFKNSLKNKKIPILTLDNRWHELFPEYDKPPVIKELEKSINELIKEQGKLVNDMKDMKKLKKKLMEEIVANMETNDGADSKLKAKKLDKSQKFIKEINEKMKDSEDKLGDIPYTIKELNEKLMVESMKICYGRMKDNGSEIKKLSEWIIKVREELKQNILIKQDLEVKNNSIYSYMHDMLGAEVMQMFDEKQSKNND